MGDGAQKGITVTEKNHYFIYGLAQSKQSDPTIMANYRLSNKAREDLEAIWSEAVYQWSIYQALKI